MPQPDYEIFFHDALSTGRHISSFHDTYNDGGILLMFHCLYRRHLQDKNNLISNFWLWHIWSQTHMVPGHLVPNNWSPINWSHWSNGPQPILSPWTNGPKKFGPHGQMVPNQFGPPGQMVPRIFCLSRGTGCDDLEIWGPNWLGTICPGGPNFWGPFVQGDQIWWGPFVQGDQIGWGPFVHGDRILGDHLSMGTESGGPEVWGPNGFGTKWVAAVQS